MFGGDVHKVALQDLRQNAEQQNRILILDFGGQFTHLIARAIREKGVYTDTLPCDTFVEKVRDFVKGMNVKGIVLSGGPASVYDENAPRFDPKILELGIPVLGLCYGHQLIAQLSGGVVQRASNREYGQTEIYIPNPAGIFAGLRRTELVLMSHGDIVSSLGPDYVELASSKNSPIAAFRHKTRREIGFQFHPEVTDTVNGDIMLKN